jgi:hypothetical protein
VTASYDDRIRAITDATRLLCEMTSPQPPTGTAVTYVRLPELPPPPLDRFEVTELARFLLGLDDAADAEGGFI